MLRICNITKNYNDRNVINNINLEIDRGEFIVIIGPSGCGKTTLLKMINRLIRPSEGKILINDVDISKTDIFNLRRKIGYVFQEVGLLPHMSILENITLVPRLLKWPKEKRLECAKKLLKLVQLPVELLDRFPNEISGGQQQRVGILRALAANPSIVLMDEPFSALDPITRELLQVELKKIQRELGITLIFVTHDMDEAINMADRLLIMNEGKIIQQGKPSDILLHPMNQFVENFIGKERLLEAKQKYLTVEEIMIKNPVTLKIESTVRDAIEIFENLNLKDILVVDNENKLMGYINIESIKGVNQWNSKVRDYITNDLYTVDKEQLVRSVVIENISMENKLIPVVNNVNSLIGVLTPDLLSNILYSYLEGTDINIMERELVVI